MAYTKIDDNTVEKTVIIPEVIIPEETKTSRINIKDLRDQLSKVNDMIDSINARKAEFVAQRDAIQLEIKEIKDATGVEPVVN